MNGKGILLMKNFTLLLLLLLYLPGHFIYAQHQHHQESEDNTAQEHREQNSSTGSPMSHAFSLSLPMTRNGPGTGWLPDASPMYGYMVHGKQWMHMFHGNVFIRYNSRILPAKGCSVTAVCFLSIRYLAEKAILCCFKPGKLSRESR